MRTKAMLVLGLSLVVIGVAGLVAVSLPGAPVIGQGTCPSGVCDRTGSTGGPSATDVMFVEQMVSHHEDAIAMADLALTRSERPEILELAGTIVRTQKAENDIMRRLYEDWFGAGVPEPSGRGMGSGMMGPMMDSEAALDRLERAEDFDRAFIEAMVPHHRMGVMMASMAGGASRLPEIQELTRAIVEAQSEEIDRMLAWYREWYGR